MFKKPVWYSQRAAQVSYMSFNNEENTSIWLNMLLEQERDLIEMLMKLFQVFKMHSLTTRA